MDIQKIAKFAMIAKEISNVGLPLVGGFKALAALFGHDLTPEEQDAIEVSIVADATRRMRENRLMAGLDSDI
jgi:hypothetical protein